MRGDALGRPAMPPPAVRRIPALVHIAVAQRRREVGQASEIRVIPVALAGEAVAYTHDPQVLDTLAEPVSGRLGYARLAAEQEDTPVIGRCKFE